MVAALVTTSPPVSVRPITKNFGFSAAHDAIDPVRLAEANINPATRLATDYLNHFNEAIMMLELAPQMPDCIADLAVWRPLSYCEHFAASNFKERELAIVAYQAADPARRGRLEELSMIMNAVLVATIGVMRQSPDSALGPLSEEALFGLRPLLARAGALINGVEAPVERGEADSTQAAVDALFER